MQKAWSLSRPKVKEPPKRPPVAECRQCRLLVDRRKYADDESYLDAVIKADMERNNPEYQAARRRLKAEYREHMEREQRAEQEAAYKAKISPCGCLPVVPAASASVLL